MAGRNPTIPSRRHNKRGPANRPMIVLGNRSTPTRTPGPTPSPTPEPTASPTPEPTPSPTPEPPPSPTPAPTPSPTPELTPSPTPEPTPSPTPEPRLLLQSRRPHLPLRSQHRHRRPSPLRRRCPSRRHLPRLGLPRRRTPEPTSSPSPSPSPSPSLSPSPTARAATPTPSPGPMAVAAATQAPSTLPAGGNDSGGLDDYRPELAALFGGIVAAFGIAFGVVSGVRRRRQP